MEMVEKRQLRKRDRVSRLFERDGQATSLAEGFPLLPIIYILQLLCTSEAYFKDLVRLPVAGYLVSAVHALKGNDSHALRAAGRYISCTNFLASCSIFAKS